MASNSYNVRPTPAPVNGWGIAGFVTSIIGLFTCGLFNIISLPVSLIGLLFKPRGFAVAGTVISLIGSGMFAAICLIGWGAVLALIGFGEKLSELGREAQTEAILRQAVQKIEDYKAEHNALPEGVEGNTLVLEMKDGWEQGLRYDRTGDTYVIRSSGPDKTFDTDDDVLSNEHKFDTELKIGEGDGGPTEGPIVIPPDTNTTPTPEAPPPGEGTPKEDSEKDSE